MVTVRRALILALALLGSGASAQEPPALPFVGGEFDQDAILERMSPTFVRELRQIGTSSVTLRADLAAVRVAFKPRTDLHPRGYLAELAAYRVAPALGLDNVPPVRAVRLGRAIMRQRFRSDHAEDWPPIEAAIRWDEGATTRGAAIYWIPAMRPSELATDAGLDAHTPWLRLDGEVPEGAEGVARDLSTMLAFDYLIANWDRFSGGNVSTTAEGDRLFVRDHNVAFGQLVPGRYARLRETLERTQRFSRGFVARLAALDEVALRASLAPESEALGGRSVLDDAQLAAFLARRRALLSYVAALVAVHGAERVLVWE